jgi:hypothetical protein
MATTEIEEPGTGRFIFISCSRLIRSYKRVHAEDMKTALFLFGSKKSWIFPKNEVK